MPLNWDRNSIQRQWQPIDFDYPATLSPKELEYCRFYGIDLEREFGHFVHGFGYAEVENFRLATHYFRPRLGLSQGTMVILHGYFDHAGLFSHLIRYCLQRNFSVLIYDLPGHGLSTGEPAGIGDFQQYVKVLGHYLTICRPQFDEPWYLLGQSTGGAIAMAYLMEKHFDQANNPFRQIYLLAPLVRPAQWKKLFWQYNFFRRWIKSVKRKFMPCSHDQSFLNFLKKQDPLQNKRVQLSWVSSLFKWAEEFESGGQSRLSPVIIQGGKDTTIDWEHNLGVINQKFTEPTVHFLPHARHHLANESTEIREQVYNILDTYLTE